MSKTVNMALLMRLMSRLGRIFQNSRLFLDLGNEPSSPLAQKGHGEDSYLSVQQLIEQAEVTTHCRGQELRERKRGPDARPKYLKK